MFKIGTKYEFRILEGGEEVTFWGIIESYEHPLLKLADTELSQLRVHIQPSKGPARSEVIGGVGRKLPGQIINVTSTSFVSAVEHS